MEEMVIDWKRVSELRAEIGAAEFSAVVELFLEEVDTVLQRLRAAPDPAQLEEDLHFVKGCAVNLGFEGLAKLCLDGEILAAQGQPEKIDLPPILACYDASRIEFLSRLDTGLAA